MVDYKRIAELAAKAKEGDAEALSALCEEKSRTILYHTLKNLGNRQDAQDAAQEALIRICRNIGSLKDPNYFNGWAYKIVLHTCREFQRSRRRSEEKTETGAYALDVADADRDVIPHAYAEDADKRERLLRIVSALPKKRRTAILMYYYDGMNYAEIAEAMGVSTSTVSTNLLRGKEMIRKAYEAAEKAKGETQRTRGKAMKYRNVANTGAAGAEIFAALPALLCEEAARLVTDADVSFLMEAVKPALAGLRISAGAAVQSGAVQSAAGAFAKTVMFTLVGTALVSAGAAVTIGAQRERSVPPPDRIAYVETAQEDTGDEETRPESQGDPAVTEIVTESTERYRVVSGSDVPQPAPIRENPNPYFPEPADPPATDPAPALYISFSGGDCVCGHVNPTGATVGGDCVAGAIRWFVTGEDDETVLFGGEGPNISLSAPDLDEGSYLLRVEVADADGKLWNTARGFLILRDPL
ncbi:MAG: sigma-70 family RNA polymerase sigma factor [Clostridiales Family XIII bacterium]|jgi:RNA polymerase sigma-70 factor (ECF subfamily)|nr:sigma-70 family RNA polymerase sigma factor [Clostridiales Family XIII bacterium]